ncbi:MAG TPA: bifunctional 4-hydroxy-2-oxoglutarate aldolase/2-dehydro-3-deoxy-phosphogluconate aldolase [Chloroflexota bacterium]|nr:bifunctional 4-hydroxy-2-oxoglutarate aldolase/2-dehydro-3-deoxy-phosphogluconate aldolase [Chloroflexota bacterium]
MPDPLVQRIYDAGIVAIMRRTEAALAIETAEALLVGGVSVVEVTLNSPGAEEMLRTLAERVGERMLIGAGTVMTTLDARRALSAGARFIVSPHTDADVIAATRRAGAPAIPGAFTPTEIVRAWQLGASVVKVFPVGSVGPRYLRDVLAPLTDIPLLPTGGVTLDNAAEFIRAGARGLGLGSDLVSPKAVAARDFASITERARRFVDEVRKGRAHEVLSAEC